MQSDAKELYKITAQRTGKCEAVYKDVGNFIQQELYTVLREPRSIITKLKGVGSWYLRKRRLEQILRCFPPYYEQEGFSDFESERAFLTFVDKQKFYKNFKERLKEYEEYVLLKNQIRKEKHEFKQLLESKKSSPEPSQDKP